VRENTPCTQFNDLQNKFGGCSTSKECRFSESLSIAYRVGHKSTTSLAFCRAVRRRRAADSQRQAAVRVEWQADLFTHDR
jgi:predicted metalloprotease